MKSIETLPSIITELSAPFPEHLLQHRSQGGTMLTSIAWHTAADRLDEVYPYWSQNVEKVEIIGTNVVATVSVTLQFTDAQVTRTNSGIESVNTDSWGDPVSNAIAMAFKRAAAMFGVARYLYHKDSVVSPSSTNISAFPTNGTAAATTPTGEMASTKQINAIYAIAKSLNQTYDRFFPEGVKKLDQLTKLQAGQIIEKLNQAKGRG